MSDRAVKGERRKGTAAPWQGERKVVAAAEIHVVDRLRAIDAAWAEALAESIRQQGLVEPPVVRPRAGGGYDLVAGAHRLQAMDLILGWSEIPVLVVEMGDMQARLMEIDENLCRRGLEPLDRAVFLAERKAVYEALHPEAREHAAGGAAKSAAAKIAAAGDGPAIGFAREVRERIGLSERTIYRAVQVASGLAPEVRRQMQRYAHWKEGELYALSKLPAEDQVEVVEGLLNGATPGDRPDLGAALRARQGAGPQEADDGGLSRLLSAWNRADGPARRSFIGHLRETGALKGRQGAGGDDAT
jgi:ParB family chromosome partitioning protein